MLLCPSKLHGSEYLTHRESLLQPRLWCLFTSHHVGTHEVSKTSVKEIKTVSLAIGLQVGLLQHGDRSLATKQRSYSLLWPRRDGRDTAFSQIASARS